MNPLSVNSEPAATETEPIAGTGVRLFRRFGALLTSDNNVNNTAAGGHSSSSDGYVEFGISEPDRTTRHLGTFAGVFSPVALSMFSALLFIRVGKNPKHFFRSFFFLFKSKSRRENSQINPKANFIFKISQEAINCDDQKYNIYNLVEFNDTI